METLEGGSLAQIGALTGETRCSPRIGIFYARPWRNRRWRSHLLGTAAVTSDQATAIAARPARAAPAPARPILKLPAFILRDCRDVDYGRVDGFEGMLSDFVCGS